jgi:hypothetical protein
MKYLLMIIAVAVTVVSNVNAASREDFYFSNRTGTTVVGLYVAPHGTRETWGANCLSSELVPGETKHFAWELETGVQNWDVRIAYSTGVHADFYGGFDLASINGLVLSLSDYGTVSHLDAR